MNRGWRAIWLMWAAVGGLLAAATSWALAEHARLGPPGLRAEVFSTPDFSSPATIEVAQAALDPVPLAAAGGLDPAAPFAIKWSGLVVVEEQGRHVIRTAVDDGVWVRVGDGSDALIDALTAVGSFDRSAPVDLTRGLHPIEIRYVQAGGEARLRVSAAPPSWREQFAPLRLLPGPDEAVGASRTILALRLPRLVAFAWSLWLMAGLILLLYILVGRVAGASPDRALGWRRVLAVLLVGAALLGPGVGVGLHPERGWVADEVPPRDVMLAIDARFGGEWYHLYPPLPFYLFSIVASPFPVLGALGALDLNDAPVQRAMHLSSRMLVVAMGLLTVLAAVLLADRVVERRRALPAGAFLLGAPVLILYGKTTNVDVPYLLWTVLALLALVRIAQAARTVGTHAMLGALTAAAVATKDQSFAFFPGVAIVVLVVAWRASSTQGGWARRLRRVATDGGIWTGTAVCAVVYACLVGLPWNTAGYISHLELITGRGSAPFRMFPATLSGAAELAVETARMVPAAVGPLTVMMAILGLGVAISNPHRFRMLLLLTVPVATYAVLFIAVVGYTYDRFLLGPAVVMALFASLGAEWVLGAIKSSRVRQAAVVIGLAALWAPAVVLDCRVVTDSRLGVERWMAANVVDDPHVVGVGTQVYLPNLRPFRHHLEIRTGRPDLLAWDADVLVVNTLYLDRPGRPAADAVHDILSAGGYRRVFEAGGLEARAGLARAMAWGTFVHPVYSNVAKVDPPLSVWRKADRGTPR